MKPEFQDVTVFFGSRLLNLKTCGLISVVASCAQKSNTSCAVCLHNVTVSVDCNCWNLTSCCEHVSEMNPLLVQCLWCEPSKRCADYPVGKVLPPNSLCPLNDARWGVCWGKTDLPNLPHIISVKQRMATFLSADQFLLLLKTKS